MSFNFGKYNSQFSNPFKVGTDNDYVSLADLGDGFNFCLEGVFINRKSRFGAHPVAQAHININGERTLVNISLPQHMNETFKQILADNGAIEAVNQGQCFCKVEKFHSKKYNRESYSVRFISADQFNTDRVTLENIPF